MGRGGAPPHVREAGALPGDELLLPLRALGPRPRVVLCTEVSREEVDKLHQRSNYPFGYHGDARGQSCEQCFMVCGWDHLQLVRVPEIQGVVGEAQLYIISWFRCWGCVYGDARVLRIAVLRYPWPELVGVGVR